MPDTDDKFNEVDFDDNNYNKYENELRDELKVESVIIIAICSLLSVAAFFAILFFYYTRGKPYIKKYMDDKEWDMPSLPSLPSLPNLPKMPKVGPVNWPLSNVQIKKLPQFLHKKTAAPPANPAQAAKKVTTVSAPINMLSSTNEAATGPPNALPRAPPRSKKQPAPVVPSQQRLATITARPHNGSQMTRPSAPPPVVPPTTAVLEISTPTSVTINGVSVSNSPVSSAEEQVTISEESSNVKGGWIVPARPAMADADIPDSLEPQGQAPPPLPTCPPPEFDDAEGGYRDQHSKA